MYLTKLNGMVIGVEELSIEECRKRESAGFTVIKIK